MDLETSTISGVARQYREEGYEVVVHPQGGDLPPFLAGFAPDLIATRGREGVVVEALRDRGELARDPGVARLAEALEARPGWRLDLILLGAGDDLDRAARGGVEPSAEELSGLLARAGELAAAGEAGLGCVAALAGFEAALRRLPAPAGSRGWAGAGPVERVRMLYSLGDLSREEFDRVREAGTVRARVVRGLMPGEVDPALAAGVVDLARRLVAG